METLTTTFRSTECRVGGQSVRGASHVRAGIPNQDAIECASDSHRRVAVAVSDGHGGAVHVRSASGAAFAVRAAASLVLDRMKPLERIVAGEAGGGDAHRAEMASLWDAIFAKWCEAVDADLASRPLALDEYVERTGDPDEAAELFRRASGNRYAYGATLLIAVASPAGLWLWRLGDGNVVTVAADGSPTNVFDDEPGDESFSLCNRSPRESLETTFVEDVGASRFVLVSTDGYRKSYDGVEDFVTVPRDIAARVASAGFDAVLERLPSWLQSVTTTGSGDDITAGIIWREEAAPAAEPEKQTDASPASEPGEQEQSS